VKAVLSLARPELLALNPYAHAAWLPDLTRLHANEAPWRPPGDSTAVGLNRYPEPQPAKLVDRLAQLFGVSRQSVLATHGSDEAIDICSRLYLRAGQDAIIQCTPTFGMYQVAAKIQGGAVIDIALAAAQGWKLDPEQLIAAWEPRVKLVYLCSPNNPTGNLLDAQAVEYVIRALDGKAIVVIDEAYVEWSGASSFATKLEQFETLAILRTLSKAHALAGARCGALIANPDLISLARRIVPPYSLSQPTIEGVLYALDPERVAQSQAKLTQLLAERDRFARRLAASPLIERVWPSDANFMLVDCVDADLVLRAAIAGGYIVRDVRAHPALPRSLRISVGTQEQNDGLLKSLEAA
jgi:histidinol-phosphate aminotransferase